jgi:pilus assembly protein CpaF
MNRDDIAYEKLATSLCEEFHKKQGAGLLANLEKRNLDALEVSREKILENMKSELGQYEDENGQGLSDEDKADCTWNLSEKIFGDMDLLMI